ncbi:MAG: ATP-dependent Clp protease ATP-binding subunit [Verrucomicrobiales bacterium]|nr:ATP-dependent Clp protease ATP-binding subunit [Verrucomicrobiales bacterium]
MAKVFRFPICTWQSAPDTITVRMVDDGYTEAVVTADSKKDAVTQLKEYLAYLTKAENWRLFDPDFFDPKLRVLKFSVLPEYNISPRTFPCREAVRFRLPCITGKREAGSPVAFLPTLGVFFDYHREDSFQQLAIHIAQRQLSGKTPAELSRFLPPGEIKLDQISVTLKESSEGPDPWEQRLKPLPDVADHLGAGGFRRVSKTWEREREVNELVRLLSEDSSSVCLVGESGCGKTAVLIDAARRLERAWNTGGGEKPRRFWMTSGSRLVAGMRWLGQWQERLEEVIARISSIPGVLCIENLMELTRLGGSTPESSLAAFLVPYLESGELRIVAEATPTEIDALDRVLPGLIDRMQVMKLQKFTPDQSKKIVTRAADFFTQNDKVAFGATAAERTHDLFARFQPYVAFPGKVIQFMGNLVDRAPHSKRPEITARTVEDGFSETTGLPDFLVRDSRALEYGAIVDQFQEKLIAQDPAVETVCRLVAKFSAGLNDPNRPIGVLLFCGPTGVGKTQLVRLLGDFLFPKRPEKERIIRLDMSEYAGYDAAQRLLGTAAGEPSDLIRKMRANSFSVLLLDEIEKASDEVFDVFLNVFEEGRLTDSLGRLTSFQSSLIVMTSNLGAGSSGNLGFSPGGETTVGEVDRSAVLNFFRPEFFNRIDQVVYFSPLNREAIELITRKELNEIADREGLAAKKLDLEIDDEVCRFLAERGFDPVYGARPLQRAIEETVTLPLARWLAQSPGLKGKTIRVSRGEGDDEIVFE